MSFLDDVPKGNLTCGRFSKFTMLLDDRCLVLRLEPESRTKGGILLPDTAQERPVKGLVLLTGPGHIAELTGNRSPMTIMPGMYVYFPQYAGGKVTIEGSHYKEFGLRDGDVDVLVMKESEIIGQIEAPPKPPSFDSAEDFLRANPAA
jgi:chaperonin GroES